MRSFAFFNFTKEQFSQLENEITSIAFLWHLRNLTFHLERVSELFDVNVTHEPLHFYHNHIMANGSIYIYFKDCVIFKK